MSFDELPIGAMFKFFSSGSLLTKTSAHGYSAPQWGQHDNRVSDLDQQIILVDLKETPA